MSIAIIGLGSNMGDRLENLRRAVERISFSAKLKGISNIYETHHRFNNISEPYLNCVLAVETDMTSEQVISYLLEIERQVGSEDGDHKDRREFFSLDCDLISFDQEITRTPRLTLPHPEAHRRAYVMCPLAELLPDWNHPILKKSAMELAKESHWNGWGSFFAQGESLIP